ncbi:MAG: methyltransferase domain-containing protein, partial [Anaerolineae bacterium]|nr:methyltransferase domain-containing protein [Anaerolineae bacterium]
SAAISIGAYPVGGSSTRLPFKSNTFDLVFSQFSLFWMPPLTSTSAEIRRILQPGGVLIALEPDYGGMIEYPPEITSRHIWIQALSRTGAEPYAGRKLPAILEKQGFSVQVRLIETLQLPAVERFAFLKELTLDQEELQALSQIEHHAVQLTGWQQIAHLPLFFITAEKK